MQKKSTRITGIDVGTRNLSLCTVSVYNTAGKGDLPDFRIHEWVSIDLGGKTVQQNVNGLVSLIKGKAFDLDYADTFVIEAQLGGKFGNPTMKAIAHVLQSLISAYREEEQTVVFMNSNMKFSTWKDIRVPHTSSDMKHTTRGKRTLMTKENAIAITEYLLKHNNHEDGDHYYTDFTSRYITKHKRKDYADSLGLALTAWMRQV
jgi:hypothetical protein